MMQQAHLLNRVRSFRERKGGQIPLTSRTAGGASMAEGGKARAGPPARHRGGTAGRAVPSGQHTIDLGPTYNAVDEVEKVAQAAAQKASDVRQSVENLADNTNEAESRVSEQIGK